MVEEYFQLTSMFHIGTQEDATELFLQASMFIDYSNEEFVKDVLYNIQLQQNICCLICDERSQHMEDGNRLIYLALDIHGVKESSVSDLIYSYFADELLEQHLCDSCKSEETAVSRKIANCPPVLTFALKRYRGDSRATKCRNIVHPLIAIDLEKHMTDKRSTLYRLRAIIIHKGKNLNRGHYTSVIISENLKIQVDDHNVSLSDFQSFNSTVLQDGYVFMKMRHTSMNENETYINE